MMTEKRVGEKAKCSEREECSNRKKYSKMEE